MKVITLKQCMICQKSFRPSHPNRVTCDECRWKEQYLAGFLGITPSWARVLLRRAAENLHREDKHASND